MDVLVPDNSTVEARLVTTALQEGGHRVHSCVAEEGALPCAALVGRACPLDTAPVDIVVDVAHDRGRSGVYGDGALCGVRRHLPLVLTGDAESHPLAPWAAAVAGGDVCATVAAVTGRPLPGHSAVAARTLLHELRHQGAESSAASVEVFRHSGRLVVELRTDGSVSRTQAERLSAHVAQAVRLYDRWAPKLDVTVHTARPDRAEVVAPV